MQNGASIVENSMEVLKKLKMKLPYFSEILFLGIYIEELKSESQRDISTPMFIAALFTGVKI